MEEAERVVCDTNILLEVIDRNNVEIINTLIGIGTSKLRVSSISYSELIVGAKSKVHLSKLVRELDRFPVLPLNSAVDLLHRRLILRYCLSHGLSIQDALIAATANESGHKLFTLNAKDFKFSEGLKLMQ